MGIYTVKRSLISAILLGGLVVSAQAADLSMQSVKDAAPSIPDGPITWMGVTFYGTIDVGYADMSHGLPASGAFYVGPNYTIYGSKYANGNVSTLTNNALSQSSVGLKIEENIGYGLQAIGKIETGFNPHLGRNLRCVRQPAACQRSALQTRWITTATAAAAARLSTAPLMAA